MQLELTAEDINQAFTACGHSVTLINRIIAGAEMARYPAEEKNERVWRNDWYIEDTETRTDPASKSAIASAIASAEEYLPDGYEPTKEE